MSTENTCNCKHAALVNALVAELGNTSVSRLDFGTTYHSLRKTRLRALSQAQWIARRLVLLGDRLGPEIFRWREEILFEEESFNEPLDIDSQAWPQTLPTHRKTDYGVPLSQAHLDPRYGPARGGHVNWASFPWKRRNLGRLLLSFLR